MAGQEALRTISIDAGADLSALQYTAVIMGTDKTVVGATTTTSPIIGILQNKPVSGDPALVAIGGVAKAKVGSDGWTAGQKLTAAAGGALIATTTEPNHTIGIALEVAAAGDYAQLLVVQGMVSAA